MTVLPALSGHDIPAPRLFGRTVAAEATRLRTVRTTWWFLAAAALVIVGIGTIAGRDASGDPTAEGKSAWLAAAVPLLPGQFALLEIPADLGSDVVFIEGQAGPSYLDAPVDVALYKDVLADATARALDPHESRRVIGSSPVLNAPRQEGKSAR